jgi:hypothetical protein
METQPENHNDKVPIEEVLKFLEEVKALAQLEKKARETKAPVT